MRLVGEPFQNSDTCRGEAYVAKGAPSDMAIITITGRYPEAGSWALNRECYEFVVVARGVGRVAIDGAWHGLKPGDGVSIPPGTLFAWDGDMTIAMPCTPPFNPEQYEIIKIEKEEKS
ncbi:MAG: AraC family ligand binding domain-containing protein [Candidatus Saccharibacteria bacterium]|nr:AraC family ligand binding domain-containing protein [Candidatus Saccharibacteria bacterium]